MNQPFWEKSYADLHARPFGGPSKEIMELIPGLSEGAKVLDLGCGDGRNAIPLARAGFEVSAIDISKAGIGKLKKITTSENLPIKASLEDMARFEFSGQYDLIVAQGSLHLMQRHLWQRLIKKIKAHTKANGFNAITVFTDQIPPSPDMTGIFVGLLREGELFSCYSDWETTLQKSYVFEDEHEGGVRHTHAANKLVARKPNV